MANRIQNKIIGQSTDNALELETLRELKTTLAAQLADALHKYEAALQHAKESEAGKSRLLAELNALQLKCSALTQQLADAGRGFFIITVS